MFSRFKKPKGKSPYLQEDSSATSSNDSSASVVLHSRALIRGTADVLGYTPDIDRLTADPSRMEPHPQFSYLLLDTFDDPSRPIPEFGTCAQTCLAVIHRTHPEPAHAYYRGLAYLVLGSAVNARLKSREPGPLGFKRRDPLYDMVLNGQKAVTCLEEALAELEKEGKGFIIVRKEKEKADGEEEGEGEGEVVEEKIMEDDIRKRLFQAKTFCDAVSMTEGWKSGVVPGPMYFPRVKDDQVKTEGSGIKDEVKVDENVSARRDSLRRIRRLNPRAGLRSKSS